MTAVRPPRAALAAFLALSLLPALLLFATLWIAPVPDGQGTDLSAKAMRGYANMAAAGEAVLEGMPGLLFDRPSYAAWVRTLFGPGMPEQMWGYPPSMLLLAVPAALLPLGAGFLLWTAGTLAAFRAALRTLGLGGAACAAALLSPAAAENALSGQNGALTAALLVGGLALVGRRPVAAGVLFGLLTLKPQMGLLLPVCLVAANDRRAVAAAVATAAALAAAGASLSGMDAWFRFATETRAFMGEVMARPWTGEPAQLNFASPFMAARALGAPGWLAWAVQAAVSAACASLAWKAWRAPRADRALAVALTVPLALLATPYAHNYDLVATAASVAVLATAGLRGGWMPGERAALAAAWVWPGLSLLLPVMVPALGPAASLASPLVLAALAFSAHRRAADASKDSSAGDRMDEEPSPLPAPGAPHLPEIQA